MKNEKMYEHLKLIKITVPRNKDYDEYIVYFLTKENANLELIKKVFISNLKKSLSYSLIPERCFKPYLESIFLGKKKKPICQNEEKKIFLNDIENYIVLRDSNLGFLNYKFIELYFNISFSDLKNEYKQMTDLQKSFENNEFIKYNYPNLKENLNNFNLIPSYEEILSMPLEKIRCLRLSIENKFGKIIYFDPIDLEGVNLDCILLEYFYFEIMNIHKSSFMKLNKRCKVFLLTDEIKNEHDYIVCVKQLKEHFKKLKVKYSFNK